jgi:hypothetical protein
MNAHDNDPFFGARTLQEGAPARVLRTLIITVVIQQALDTRLLLMAAHWHFALSTARYQDGMRRTGGSNKLRLEPVLDYPEAMDCSQMNGKGMV